MVELRSVASRPPLARVMEESATGPSKSTPFLSRTVAIHPDVRNRHNLVINGHHVSFASRVGQGSLCMIIDEKHSRAEVGELSK